MRLHQQDRLRTAIPSLCKIFLGLGDGAIPSKLESIDRSNWIVLEFHQSLDGLWFAQLHRLCKHVFPIVPHIRRSFRVAPNVMTDLWSDVVKSQNAFIVKLCSDRGWFTCSCNTNVFLCGQISAFVSFPIPCEWTLARNFCIRPIKNCMRCMLQMYALLVSV